MPPSTHDVIIIGAGIIGLSLALELREKGLSVVVLERGEPVREASWAAAGMLAAHDPHTPTALLGLAVLSAKVYPEFARRIEELSSLPTSYAEAPTLHVSDSAIPLPEEHALAEEELRRIEPALSATANYVYETQEAVVDPRVLCSALLTACKRAGVEVHHEHEVQHLVVKCGAVAGVRTSSGAFIAAIVVNCAGAWAATIPGCALPVAPVKGHMLAVVPRKDETIRHTIRAERVYMVPREDGRIIIGSTLENAGFDKRVDPQTIQRLHQLAADLVPVIGEARIAEAWTGVRPGTPDELPIIGMAPGIGNYLLCTGHYRNGILLAPATAKLVTQTIVSGKLAPELLGFSPARFST